VSQEAQKSTAAETTFFLRGGGFTDIVITDIATSVIRSCKSIIVSASLAAETENVSGFLLS